MRHRFEIALRAVGIGTLLLALILSWRSSSARPAMPSGPMSAQALGDSTGTVAARELASRIALAAHDSLWPSVVQSLTRIPDAAVREVLAAPVAAGMPFTWTDSTGAVGLVVAATSALDPQGGTVVRAAGAPKRPLVVRDDGGLLDSVPEALDGLTVRGARLSGRTLALQGTSRAVAAVPNHAPLKRVLLVAAPGWEAKFSAAALEERGWHVDGRLLIARRASVTIGTPSLLDTARYGAVVVLDSGLIALDVLQRFVIHGGGVIVANDALLGTALRPLLPAVARETQAGVPGALLTASPRLGLDAWTLAANAGAVVLLDDARGVTHRPTVLAQRRGAGRVVVSAYRDTWRWRMEGSEDGLDAHRAFWSGLVSAVTLAPRSDATTLPSGRVLTAYPGDAAPFADLVARLGAPKAVGAGDARSRPLPTTPNLWLLYVIAASALLGEWALRRVRGAP